MIKNIAAFMFSCLISIGLHSQTSNIVIGLVVPEQQEQIDTRAFQMLKTKMQNLLVTNGISSIQCDNFIMYPVVNIIKSDLIEGGMKSIVRVEIEVSICIYQYSSKTSFGGYSSNLQGNGITTSDAIMDAFSKISPNEEFANFMERSKNKIIHYYITSHKSILAKAKLLAASKQYVEAMALLYAYPPSIEGAQVIQEEAFNIYKQYQNAVCSQWILIAEGDIALQNYINAIEVLSQIDSESSCKQEACNLINLIKEKIQDDEKKQEYIAQREQAMLVGLEKSRINAIKEIAKAYYENQPSISYMQIIK